MTLPNSLYKSTQQRFKHLIGKKVRFFYKGKEIVGTLEFAGVNHLLHGKFQVTVDRTPYWQVDPNTIKEIK